MIGRILDKAIGVLAPGWAASRMQARATMSQIEQFASGPGGYDAGKNNRLNTVRSSLSENGIPQGQLHNLRARSWDLYRNNPHARKIVNALCSKVVGKGLEPQSQAVNADGTPHVAFRQRAQALWRAMYLDIDARGRPGAGGQSLPDLQRCALRACILGGDALFRVRTPEDFRGPVPFSIQLIHADRLDEGLTVYGTDGNRIYRGIEVDSAGRRVRYHVLPYHPSDPLADRWGEPEPVSAASIGHLYIADDIDQLRGVPWFAPILMQIRDTGDYQYNELVSSAMAACFAVGVRRPTGQSSLGLNVATDWSLTDEQGNPIHRLQPGMMVNLGRDGEFDVVNPNRTQSQAEAWIGHLLRSTATGAPGIKSSTITGDYRASSFSSERAADNDTWPEIECLQEWFAAGFTQPLYERLLTAAVLAGYFDGIVTAEEYDSRRESFAACHWQGPVLRSINPIDDETASVLAIRAGLSTPQIECAKRGRNWRSNLDAIAEFQQYAEAAGIKPDLVEQYLGIAQTDSTSQAGMQPQQEVA